MHHPLIEPKDLRKMPEEKVQELFSELRKKRNMVLRTNINSGYFIYEDGSDQGFLKISFGPEIRLGRLERNLFD